jgi:2-oxoglutarate dehydrogenase complex dehydrogenase (E1) component-like enzyme
LPSLRRQIDADLRTAHAGAKRASVPKSTGGPARASRRCRPASNFSPERLRELARGLATAPAEIAVHPKVRRVLDRRASMLRDEDAVDWAHAELLALAAVADRGVPVRMTGQDVKRGTFSQRHLELTSADNGEAYPIFAANTVPAGRIQLWNSPLSEAAVLGFEYGYSIGRPQALTIWEAQFGDFANGAQVIVDQFIMAGQAKWGELSRLVMLLPHGYEGAGPEHSSGRLERYLQMAAQGNVTVAVPTTPAQYFALLVSQAEREVPRPLIAFTPKSLLRHPDVVSSVTDLSQFRFNPVLTCVMAPRQCDVRRVIICSGKIFYELAAYAAAHGINDAAILRLEQLYPFPADAIRQALRSYARRLTATWVQEEPRNMGAAAYVLDALQYTGIVDAIRYCGRGRRAATAEGYEAMHKVAQRALISSAFE